MHAMHAFTFLYILVQPVPRFSISSSGGWCRLGMRLLLSPGALINPLCNVSPSAPHTRSSPLASSISSMETCSYRPANEETGCQKLDGGRDGELKWTVEATITFEQAGITCSISLTEHVTTHSCHPACRLSTSCLFCSCALSSPLPLAAAASHTPRTPPPDIVATTPPRNETGEYTVTAVECSVN